MHGRLPSAGTARRAPPDARSGRRRRSRKGLERPRAALAQNGRETFTKRLGNHPDSVSLIQAKELSSKAGLPRGRAVASIVAKMREISKIDRTVADEVRRSLIETLFTSSTSLGAGAVAGAAVSSAVALASRDPWLT